MWSSRPVLIALALSALIVIVGRLPSLARPIWNTDEAFTAVTANVILQGGTPYRDAVDHRAPVTNFVFALIFSVAGKNNMLALHVALMAVIVGILGLLALLARQIMPTRGVVFTLIYFAVVSTLAFEPSNLLAFHTEWVVIVFTSLGVCLCWRALNCERPLGWAILCGVCYGLACFTKQPAGLDVLATMTFLGVLLWAGPERGTGVSRRQVRTAILGITIGGIAAAAVVCGYFIVRGAWSDFFFYVWTYNRSYYMPAVPFYEKLTNIYTAYYSMTVSLGLGLFAACGGLLSVGRAAGWIGQPAPSAWRQFHVALWAISSLLAGLTGGRPYAHYFIMLLPAWCLLAGLTFDSFITALRPIVPADMPLARKCRRIALIVLLGVCLLGPHLVIQLTNIDSYLAKIQNWVQHESKDPLLTFIRSECPVGERIIVWGFCPEIYVETDRDPATRYSYTNFIVGLMPGVVPASREAALRWAVPGTAKTFLDELRNNRPLFIVDVSGSTIYRKNYFGFNLFPLDIFKETTAILSESYELVPQFSPGAPGDEGTRVYRRRHPGKS